MNKISLIATKNYLLSLTWLWTEEEVGIISGVLASLQDDNNLSSRDKVIDAFQAADSLSERARYLICQYVNKVPPAVIGMSLGNPHSIPEPLSIEKLCKMDGIPVWVHNSIAGKSFWMLAYSNQCSNRLGYLEYRDYQNTWVAYGSPNM